MSIKSTLAHLAAGPWTTALAADHKAMTPLVAAGLAYADQPLEIVKQAAGLVPVQPRIVSGTFPITYTISPEGRAAL